MRIHGHEGSPLAERDKVPGATASGSTSAPSTDTQAKAQSMAVVESVVVSSGAAELAAQSAKSRATQLERVAKVKAAVQDGTYKVDLDKLAQKFIDEEMGGSRR